MTGGSSRAGRRPRRQSPMPNSAFTAFVEQHIFFYLMGGSTNELSSGVRRTITRLIEADEQAAEVMAQARAIVAKARETLGEDATQKEVLVYVKDNWDELSA